jgi:hypothetical protein
MSQNVTHQPTVKTIAWDTSERKQELDFQFIQIRDQLQRQGDQLQREGDQLQREGDQLERERKIDQLEQELESDQLEHECEVDQLRQKNAIIKQDLRLSELKLKLKLKQYDYLSLKIGMMKEQDNI